jgi:DNA-binding MarR family transcriptional regulator
MSRDFKSSDIMPVIMQASRAQLTAMMGRLSARGFEGLTPAFAGVMPLLDATGMRSTLLAQRAGVTKQAMSQLVRLLEERKYVEQISDPGDTRAKVVRLTKRGVALRKACFEVRQELHATAARTLGSKKLEKLHADLTKLIQSLSGPPEQ